MQTRDNHLGLQQYLQRNEQNRILMSLTETPANLKPIACEGRFIKPLKGVIPKINYYRPTGGEDQNTNFELTRDQHNLNNNSFIEDSRKSNFTFKGLILTETSLLILSITSFITEIHVGEHNDLKLVFEANILLICQSVITMGILMLLIFRYKLDLLLRKQQKIQSLNANLFHRQYFVYMLIEIMICVVHPNYFTKQKIVILFEPYDQINIEHQVNDILALFMLFRIYLIIRALVITTVFSGTRAGRLCRIHGCQHNFMFSIKCIMNQIPLRALAFFFILMVMIYGQGLRISEHSLIGHFPGSFDLSNYENCYWTIIITMGTVGYGDYFPRTYPGRSIIFLASISGIVMTSLLIITLSRYLAMDNTETKAHITNQRLKLRGHLQNSALQAVKQTAILGFNLKTSNPKLKSSFSNLKKHAQNIKITSRKLQTIIDAQNVNQQMNRLFQILQKSLKQIYENQVQVKNLLQDLYHKERDQLRQIKFSFSSQIQQMIKQY